MIRILLFIMCILFSHGASSFIKKECQNKHIRIYTKEFCKYCIDIKQLLDQENLNYEEIEIRGKEILYSWLVLHYKQRTVPFVFIDDVFIGGYADFIHLCQK